MDTDFSVDPDAIGGVLSQEQDGQERVIAYGARRLQPRERNYASTKVELLAVIFFLQYYKYYLLHRPFILRTDNRALTWIRSLESPTGMILRWLEILASFDFTVKHRKGTLHGNADALSRAPHAALPSPQEEKILVSDEAAVVAALQAPPGFTLEELKDHQDRDEHLSDVRRWKSTPPSEAEKQLLSPDKQRLLALLPSLHQDATTQLWSLRTPDEGNLNHRLYVPHALRHRIIEAALQFLGQAGINATAHFCRSRVFMFRLIPEVHRVIRQCSQCQVKDQKAPKQKEVYRPSVQAGASFQVWSMDILGPLRASSEGNRYLLTLKEVFSKWFEAVPLSSTTSDKVLRALQLLYARFGHPLQVHTDNATYFHSQLMKEAFQRAGIKLTFTPTYNPQPNSVERVHRDLNAMLRALCHQHAADWEEVLPAALLALRSAVHESTGVTPFACVYGREPATPLDVLCHFPGAPMAANNYVRRLEDHQFKAHHFVQTQLARAIQRSSRRYGNERDAIQVGEKVWLFTSKPSADRKLAIPYTGPWRVTHQPTGTLRTIHPEGGWCQRPKSITVSLNRLKRCHGEDGAPQRVDFDLRQLEDTDDDAEGPMINSWVTTERAAATQALNQDAGDVHTPGLRGGNTGQHPPEALRTSRPAAYSRSIDDVTPSILIHHEHTNVVSPADQSSNTQSSSLPADPSPPKTSALPIDTAVHIATIKTSAAPKSQESFNRSVKVRPCSSFAIEEAPLPAVPETPQDDVFEPDFSSWRESSTATAYSATAPTDSSSDTMISSPDLTPSVAEGPPRSSTRAETFTLLF